jgi:hypothetical protein
MSDDTENTAQPDSAKLIAINGGGKPDEMAEAGRRLRANVPRLIENYGLFAQLTRAKYDALVAHGFTEQQALELSKGLW